MKHSRLAATTKLASLLLVLALLLVSSASAAPVPPERGAFETVKLPPGAATLSADVLAGLRGAHAQNPKLDSTMSDLAAAAKVSGAQALGLAAERAVRVSGDRVLVHVATDPARLQGALAAIRAVGGEVTKVARDETLIQGWLPVGALETVAASDDVLYARRPAEAILLEGTYTTEGVAAMGAAAWQAAGHRGAGAKIAVIDGGFQGYPSLLGTDLPASVTVKNFVDGETDAQVNGSTVHGTACAEVIHDVAPDAQLYLAKIATHLDLQEAVSWAQAQQVKIISTSVGWYNVTPGDGTGFFANLVSQARSNGILWVTAAGNDREAHWGGTFVDANGNGYHEFAPGQEVDYFGPGDGNAIGIPAGYPIRAYLRWDDWTAVNQDFDLYILKWNGSAWETCASSTNLQNGGGGQTPTEAAYCVTTGSGYPYALAIRRSSATRNVNLEAFAPKVYRLDKIVTARSLANLADAPGAMTVAALNVVSPYAQEPYSSEGPTNGPGGIATGGAIKPDISGYANVSTVSYGTTNKFNGTSAATPHVAGAAALALAANPTYIPDQLRSFLEGRALEMGPAGKDTQFGVGRLYLGTPPSSQLPQITGFAPVSGPAGTSVSITGTNFTGASAVTFNGASASYTVNSATSITATVPAGATTGPIGVTTPDGTATSSASFTVTMPAPTITSFSPTSGPAGTSVTITGTNFNNPATVTFNGVSASHTVNSASSITATVPAGATTGPIGVTTPAGTATSATSFTVTQSIRRVYLPLVMRGDAASGWVTIVSEDFEGAFPGSWQLVDPAGSTWGKRSCASFAGSYSGWAVGGGANGTALSCGSNYPNNVTSAMIHGPFSLVGATAGDLKLKVWQNTLQASDLFCVLASTNGSNFWGDCYSGSTGGTWQEVPLNLKNVYSLGNLMGQPNVWVALYFETDASTNTSVGAYADNVVLRKCTAASCPGALATTPDVGAAGLVRTTKSIVLRQ